MTTPLRVRTIEGPVVSSFVQDYRREAAGVRELFEYGPGAAATERVRRCGQLEGGGAADRKALCEALTGFNRRAGCDDAVLASIERLKRPDALVVVGGQQAGLFTGPLLVLYKAVTIIQAAKRAEAALGRPVVPVFWIAGEDHDYDEVNHLYYVSPEPSLERIRLEHPTGIRAAVSRLGIASDQWESALQRLEAALPDTEFKPGLMDKLRSLCRPSHTLTDVFAGMMAWLFAGTGLILLDSEDPSLRALERPMFRELIVRRQELGLALLEGKNAVETAGYSPQADVREDSANLFIHWEGERLLLLKESDRGFATKRSDVRFTEEQLLELLEREPWRFSNNALTRPLMQEYLFPVASTVLGPGEIAYWGLLKPAFRLFGLSMPPIEERLTFTLLDGIVGKHMGKYELREGELWTKLEERRQLWLDAQDSLRLKDRFAEVKRSFAESYGPLLEDSAGLNPGLRKLGETNLQKIVQQIEYMENRALDAQHAGLEAAIRQWDKIRLSVVPDGQPQERVLNVLPYLSRYGNGWLSQLCETCHEPDGLHRIVYL